MWLFKRWAPVVLGLIAAALAGCSSDSSEADSTVTRAATAAAETQAPPVTERPGSGSIGRRPTTSPSATTGSTSTGRGQALVDLADTVAAVRSGVVRIRVETCSDRGSGTGIIVSPRHVVTVEHVVDGASRITLERSRNKLGSAQVIGLDRDRDLALLRLRKLELTRSG